MGFRSAKHTLTGERLQRSKDHAEHPVFAPCKTETLATCVIAPNFGRGLQRLGSYISWSTLSTKIGSRIRTKTFTIHILKYQSIQHIHICSQQCQTTTPTAKTKLMLNLRSIKVSCLSPLIRTMSHLFTSAGTIEVTTPTKGKKTTKPSVKKETLGSPTKKPPPSPKKPAAKGSTNASMGPEVVKLALTLLTPDHFVTLSEQLGVDKGKLKDVSGSAFRRHGHC